MRYFIAIICPPLAVLLCGKPFQALLNLFLSILYVPGLIHAPCVVSSTLADGRNRKLIRAADSRNRDLIHAISRAGRSASPAAALPAGSPARRRIVVRRRGAQS